MERQIRNLLRNTQSDSHRIPMIDLILHDSAARPDLFSWWGPLPTSQIQLWERENSIHVPTDLKTLWSLKGGGDLFESESILQPFGAAEYDLIYPVTQVYRERGLSPEFRVFQKGVVESVFRISDGALFSLVNTDENFAMIRHADLDQWKSGTDGTFSSLEAGGTLDRNHDK